MKGVVLTLAGLVHLSGLGLLLIAGWLAALAEFNVAGYVAVMGFCGLAGGALAFVIVWDEAHK